MRTPTAKALPIAFIGANGTPVPPPLPKGHWPKGKRRNEDCPERAAVLADVATLCRKPVYGLVSAKQAAQAAQVSDRTLRRWLEGEDWPGPDAVRLLRAWVRSVRKVLPARPVALR